ncbi:MAG: leucine-rich repeat protein [Clostridia bacterium]|nr:leucine-rich repeat protein [Clostridia bacterium]
MKNYFVKKIFAASLACVIALGSFAVFGFNAFADDVPDVTDFSLESNKSLKYAYVVPFKNNFSSSEDDIKSVPKTSDDGFTVKTINSGLSDNAIVKIPNLNIPETVERIMAGAFKNCNIKILHFNANACAISTDGNNASPFIGNPEFKKAYFGDIYEVPNKGFSVPQYVCKECENLKEVEFASVVQKIQKEAFSGCISLETVIFRGKIISIADSAFNKCDKIKDIYCYDMTEEEWKSVKIDNNNDALSNKNIVWHFKDNTVTEPTTKPVNTNPSVPGKTDETVTEKPNYGVFKISILNAKSTLYVGFGSTVILNADINNSDHQPVKWIIVSNAGNTVKEQSGRTLKIIAKETVTVKCMTTDQNGNEIESPEETIIVDNSFFGIIKAFFQYLFGTLPVYEDNIRK